MTSNRFAGVVSALLAAAGAGWQRGPDAAPGKLTLRRAVAADVTHVIVVYSSVAADTPPSDEPEAERTRFGVTLGVVIDGVVRDAVSSSTEVEFDVETELLGLVGRQFAVWDLQTADVIDRVVAMLVKRGLPWFDQFTSIETSLTALEGPPTRHPWTMGYTPLITAVQIRAQRGQLDQARRDLEMHLERRRAEYTPLREPQLAACLATAARYGVPTRPDETDLVLLGWVAHVAGRIQQDWQRSRGLDPVAVYPKILERSVRLDDRTPVITLKPSGASFRSSATTVDGIAAETGAWMQQALTSDEPWPLCPTHATALVARFAGYTFIWFCDVHAHPVCQLGVLPA